MSSALALLLSAACICADTRVRLYTVLLQHVRGLQVDRERSARRVQVQAFMFGSVPLKTYLPDGDIDMAVFQSHGPSVRDSWTTKLGAVLEAEARSQSTRFRVKDMQVIHAEVRRAAGPAAWVRARVRSAQSMSGSRARAAVPQRWMGSRLIGSWSSASALDR